MTIAGTRNLVSSCAAVLLAWAGCLSGSRAMAADNPMIGNHRAVYDSNGMLAPWTPWSDALNREMNWYLACPIENGYPRFAYMTFMDGDYQAIARRVDTIPAMQNGVGIISYLKYYAWSGKKNPKLLEFARYMGDYLVKESLTPDTGKYPRFTRSTGRRGKFPQPADAGTQADKPYELEPDKGGIAGYALVLLYESTNEEKYLDQALQNARVLVANMGTGDSEHSPWPFRVDYRTGESRFPVAANMSFNLRLFDKLIEHGHAEYEEPRTKLWAWIKNYQIPNAAKDGTLWVQFFEDHAEPDNRNAWSPLNLARYLIEKKQQLDTDWAADAKTLIDFTIRNFTSIRSGVPVCGEQTYDKEPWGGILSTYGAVLAMYSAATGSDEYKALAHQALNYALYAINDDGCPRENSVKPGRGGWQEDAHTDKIHNFVDAITAYPEWAR